MKPPGDLPIAVAGGTIRTDQYGKYEIQDRMPRKDYVVFGLSNKYQVKHLTWTFPNRDGGPESWDVLLLFIYLVRPPRGGWLHRAHACAWHEAGPSSRIL
jgi:hypothetical protein